MKNSIKSFSKARSRSSKKNKKILSIADKTIIWSEENFKDFKFEGLLKKLEDKNKMFFEDLCQIDVNHNDPKKPPCLQNYDKK